MKLRAPVLLLLFLTFSPAQETVASARPSVDAVVAKAINSMGGIERIHALHSLVFRGYHYEGSYKQEYAGSKSSTAVMTRMRPNMRIVGCRPGIPTCNEQWGRITESYDGRDGWELNWPKQRLIHAVNKAQQALRCGAEFDFLFIDYKARGFTAKYLGRRVMLGRETEALQIDQAGCSSAVYFFDPKSYDLLMTELTIPIHARGDLLPTVSVYKEFMTVNGVRLPSRSEQVNVATGEIIAGGVWTSIDANTVSDPSLFVAPETHPIGITSVVLKMLKLADTESPAQMIAAFTDFRRTPDGTSADPAYDMNWLGFELLKVDKYPHAIAVFDELIREKPTSPAPYESLGEAYLQMKSRPDAIRAFEQAIALGSTDADVMKKLRQLKAASR